MVCTSRELVVETGGTGTYEITREIERFVRDCGLTEGVVTVFIRHTSASLVVFENADPSARVDLEAYFRRLVPEGERYFTHTLEGADDMPSHVRTVLTRTSETIPVVRGSLALGTWQGVFVFEHRRRPHRRDVVLTATGSNQTNSVGSVLPD